MNRRLIYVVGPSGAGKDSVLSWLREHTPLNAPVHWAKRTIDRPMGKSSNIENHQAVDAEAFEKMIHAGEFAMHWDANTHRYGIHRNELRVLRDPCWYVLVNGSRAHLSEITTAYPGVTVLHITARWEVLRQRLQHRGRESTEAIEARLSRIVPISVPESSILIEVSNNTTLEEAGTELLGRLHEKKLWPSNIDRL